MEIVSEILIELKPGIQDPVGKTIKDALVRLGYKNVKDVRNAKRLIVKLEAESKEEALRQLEEMCKRLLANPVIENYEIRLLDQGSSE